jgi:hypothetical protein
MRSSWLLILMAGTAGEAPQRDRTKEGIGSAVLGTETSYIWISLVFPCFKQGLQGAQRYGRLH